MVGSGIAVKLLHSHACNDSTVYRSPAATTASTTGHMRPPQPSPQATCGQQANQHIHPTGHLRPPSRVTSHQCTCRSASVAYGPPAAITAQSTSHQFTCRSASVAYGPPAATTAQSTSHLRPIKPFSIVYEPSTATAAPINTFHALHQQPAATQLSV
jgi:hypothetical protein